MIEVYHLSKPECIEAVIASGLKTLQLQADEGLIDLDKVIGEKCLHWLISKELLPFRLSTNYFKLDQPSSAVPWVSMIVNEDQTDVINNDLEYLAAKVYFSSRMPMSTYLSRSGNITQNLHPITAFPLEDGQKIELSDEDGDTIERTYSAEVIMQEPHISNLYRYNRV